MKQNTNKIKKEHFLSVNYNTSAKWIIYYLRTIGFPSVPFPPRQA